MGVFIRSRKERKEDKELEEYYKEIDALEKELDEEEKKNRIKIKDLFKKDPYEEDLKTYMTETEIENEEKDKKNMKRASITLGVIFAGVVILIIVVFALLLYASRSDMEKIHKPEIINYYKENYGIDLKFKVVSYVCANKTDEQEECNNIVKAVTNDNKTIYKWDKTIADDFNTESIYESYKKYIKSIIPDMFWTDPIISDVDFQDTSTPYNMFIDRARILPTKSTFNSLLITNKLIVNDIIMYQNDLNMDLIKEFIGKIHPSSQILFVKYYNANASEILYYTNGKYVSIPISTKQVIDNGEVYRYDTNYVANNEISINIISSHTIKALDENYEFNTGYNIDYKGRRYSRDEENFNYYFLALNTSIDKDSLIQLRCSSDNCQELTEDNYSNFLITAFDNKTYIFANDSINLSTKHEIKKGLFN